MLSFNTNDASNTASYAFWNALLEIIRLLPNLEILSGINRLSRAMVRDLSRVPYRDYLVMALMESCKTSLRRISFDGDAGMLVNPYIRRIFLHSFPHLQTITGGGTLLDCSIGMPEVTHANVTTLMLDGTDSSCLTLHHTSQPSFPRVTQVILRLTAAQSCTTSWAHFLKGL
ncbi:hypothetical protein EWM64_g6777 [Hericium alpestre]|uniref:Uncharacterized protein n=1 Tax=Hericium alpestre TaxID=135208 RepID=A0A4Y9ZSN0_9AGAM|nr:hypothetical protein EWM64_g6777 [Hericium alpestre]